MISQWKVGHNRMGWRGVVWWGVAFFFWEWTFICVCRWLDSISQCLVLEESILRGVDTRLFLGQSKYMHPTISSFPCTMKIYTHSNTAWSFCNSKKSARAVKAVPVSGGRCWPKWQGCGRGCLTVWDRLLRKVKHWTVRQRHHISASFQITGLRWATCKVIRPDFTIC